MARWYGGAGGRLGNGLWDAASNVRAVGGYLHIIRIQ